MSKTSIFYFSGTGNCLAVSKAVAEKLGGADIVSMVQKNALDTLNNSERIGLVFPVYVFGLPRIVTRFITSLRIPGSTYVFAVAVHGGMPFGTLKQAAGLFTQNGMTLSAGYEVLMVDNYLPFAGAISPEKQQKRFKKAKLKIEAICSAIERGDRRIHPGLPLLNGLLRSIYKSWERKVAGADTDFTVDASCNACGICAKICPVENIKISDRLPGWQHHCEQCFACIHWCPQTAIQYGKKTSGRRRYHHPDIKFSEMFLQN